MLTSIIIPTFNRSATLRITIESLLSLASSPDDYEIIIADNGSTDDTSQLVQSFIRLNPERQLRYFFEPIPGAMSARHRGALQSKGDLLIFIDDDILAQPEWLNEIVQVFHDPEVHLACGRSLPKFEAPPPDWLEAFWFRQGDRNWCIYLSILDFGEQPMEIDPIYVWSLNYAIRRQTFFELGGFHPDYVPKPFEQYQGDGETGLAWEVQANGFKIVYQPRAIVHHIIPKHRLTIDYFEKRMFFAGVFDSYTVIRRNRGLKHQWRMQRPLPQIRRLIRRILARLSPNPHDKIKQRIRSAWLDGYVFHQREAKRDSALVEWILKKSYLDYRYGPFLQLPTSPLQ